MKKIINSKSNPTAAGPFSQAVQVGNLCFTSGQLPYDKITQKFELDDVAHATELCLEAIKNICDELNVDVLNIVKCTIFVNDINQYGIVNDVYSNFFEKDYPARSAYEVANLPFNVPVEIEAIIDCENKL